MDEPDPPRLDADDTGAAETAGLADADLVLRTRSGDRAAFGELWRRHYRSGIVVANSITTQFDADDLVQEAYARIFQAIARGGGPTGSFRAYLFTSIRHTAAGWGRRQRETPIDEVDTLADPDAEAHATDDALDRSLTAQAYRALPTRWQEVLWYTEIEQMKPAEVAPLLGMKAAAVAQLAFRAREGLREAWIQAHLRSAPEGSECRFTIERLGAYARGNLGRRDTGKVDTHLAECARCAIVAAEAKEVSHRLALVLLPLTIGAGGATAYLATVQGGAAPIVALAAGASGTVPGAVSMAGAGSSGGATVLGAVGGSGGAAGGAVSGAGGGAAGGAGGGSAGAGSAGGGAGGGAGGAGAGAAAGGALGGGALGAGRWPGSSPACSWPVPLSPPRSSCRRWSRPRDRVCGCLVERRRRRLGRRRVCRFCGRRCGHGQPRAVAERAPHADAVGAGFRTRLRPHAHVAASGGTRRAPGDRAERDADTDAIRQPHPDGHADADT
ncbi:MAG: sigma-70 family RNA polymerase sigma factor [Microbacterium sp.]